MKKLAMFTAVVMIALCAFGSMAFASSTAIVSTPNGGALNARSSMATHSNNLVASLPNGYQVTILSNSGSWSYIQFVHPVSGYTTKAYVQTRYLSGYSSTGDVGVTTEGMMLISPTTATVVPSSPTGWVNMRATATKSSTVIGRYYQNSTVTVTAVGATWCAVYDPATGRSGYMMKTFLRY